MISPLPRSPLRCILRFSDRSSTCWQSKTVEQTRDKSHKRGKGPFTLGILQQGLDLARPLHTDVTSLRGDSSSGDAKALNQWQRPSVAVIGGGITGLATAFFLSQKVPHLQITIYEGSNRLGGWIQSKHVKVGDQDVVFEQGPRTLRPRTAAGLVTLKLIKDLGIANKMLITMSGSPASSRYIYYPDRLVRVPGSGRSLIAKLSPLWTEPMFWGLIPTMIVEANQPPRLEHIEDESVGSFLNRRFQSSKITDNMASAMLHGIYAGDVYKLSAKSLFPHQWAIDRESTFAREMFKFSFGPKREAKVPHRDLALITETKNELSPDLLLACTAATMYHFEGGMETLSNALVAKVKDNPNIEVKLQEKISSIEYGPESDGIKITTQESSSQSYTQAVSTISSTTVSDLVRPRQSLPSLSRTHAVTVMAVNLHFRSPPLTLLGDNIGFGYLIPRSVPLEQNPECCLGVIFDSLANPTIASERDIQVDFGRFQNFSKSDGIQFAQGPRGLNNKPSFVEDRIGTTLTCIFGGHWWDGLYATKEDYPDEEQGEQMARAVLKRHLGIEEEPAAVNVRLQSQCIPQYEVGHHARMRSGHLELMSAFKGRLAVAGSWYTGVGLNDCVRAARDVVKRLEEAGIGEMGPDKGAVTGLESFTIES